MEQSIGKVTIEELQNWTPLRFAEETNAWNWVERFLQSGSPERDISVTRQKLTNHDTAGALMREFCSAGYIHLVKFALSHDRQLANCPLEAPAGWRPLHASAAGGQLAVTKTLLKAGADVDAVDVDGRTPAHTAAAAGSVAVFRALLLAGADRHARDYAGKVPKQYATPDSRSGIRRVLFEVGEQLPLARRRLLLAAESGCVDTARELLKFRPPRAGTWTVLHWLALRGSEVAVRTLVAAGSDPNLRDGEGATPLHAAAARGSSGAATALLDGGADPDMRDASGSTPLHYAVRTGNMPAVQALLSHTRGRLDVDATDGDGDTPLHRAAVRGAVDPVRMLVEAGADLTAVDRNGKTAFEVARAAGHTAVLALLRINKSCPPSPTVAAPERHFSNLSASLLLGRRVFST